MTKSWFVRTFAMAVALMIGWFAGEMHWLEQSQAAPALEAPKPVIAVAVMDVALIFKGHKRFNSAMKTLTATVEAEQPKIDAAQKQVALLQARIAGTTDKAEKEMLDEQLAKHAALLQAAGRSYQEAEMNLYYAAQMQIEKATKKYCQTHGISAVFRITHDAVNPNDPNSIMQGLNRSVIYYGDGSDITDAILKAVEENAETKEAP